MNDGETPQDADDAFAQRMKADLEEFLTMFGKRITEQDQSVDSDHGAYSLQSYGCPAARMAESIAQQTLGNTRAIIDSGSLILAMTGHDHLADLLPPIKFWWAEMSLGFIEALLAGGIQMSDGGAATMLVDMIERMDQPRTGFIDQEDECRLADIKGRAGALKAVVADIVARGHESDAAQEYFDRKKMDDAAREEGSADGPA
jgi:hypothetical protein